MADIARWGGHTFTVAPGRVLSFRDFTLKGHSETEEKSTSGQKYVKRKNSKPMECGMTAVLDARLGVDVRQEALSFALDARAGTCDYIYINGVQITDCKFMLVEANVNEVLFAPTMAWLRCEVALSFKQSDVYKAGGSGSGSKSNSSSKKASAKSSSSSSSLTVPQVWQDPNTVYDDDYKEKLAQRLGVSTSRATAAKAAAKSTVDTAKKTSSTKKYTPNKEFWASMAEKVKR